MERTTDKYNAQPFSVKKQKNHIWLDFVPLFQMGYLSAVGLSPFWQLFVYQPVLVLLVRTITDDVMDHHSTPTPQ